MLDRTRLKIGLWYSRFYFRKNRDEAIRFTEAVSRARRALVLFPESALDWESTQTVLKYLSRRFASGSMLLLVRDDLKANVGGAQAVKTVTYTLQDVNTWFVPRGQLLRKMKTSTFDIAVDLNFGLALPSAFLCRQSNAPLRVSFAKEQGDQFYNFQIQTRATSSNPTAYRSLLRCLDMF
ncbi:MAG: hypothetical protein WBD36_16765 [Bacteroidota bacterium]